MARGDELADEVDLDIDAEFKRCVATNAQLAAFERCSGIDRCSWPGCRDAGYLVVAGWTAFASPARRPTCIDEDQVAVLRNQVGKAAITRSHPADITFERRVRHFKPKIARTVPVSTIVQSADRSPAASASRTARRSQSASASPTVPPLQARPAQRVQARQRQRQMTAALAGSSAWISSTITVRVVDSIARPDLIRAGRATGVVTTMCGGRRLMRWRSPAGVSPVRTGRIATSGKPCARNPSRMPGAALFQVTLMSLESAYGET